MNHAMAPGRRVNRTSQTVSGRALPLLSAFLGVVVPLLIFGGLAREVWENEGFAFDAPLQTAAHRLASPAMDRAMVAVTDAGFLYLALPLALVALFWLAARRRNRDAGFFLLAVAGASAMNAVAKTFFNRPRPHLWVSPAPEFDSGFPSGRSMFSMAVVTALVILAWPTRWRWPVAVAGTLFVLAVGFSRVYLGVHYPSDVLAAWAASLAWVCALARAMLLARASAGDFPSSP